ncbi:hypothetical protein ACFRU3_46415 [Streptomyces sp. NPDC056910]|uniref:hypothetical protein n=1 Tax=Streptomyces sp. NPDC056910 TaxID=3345964 RepID=UPI0036CFF3CF
MDGGGTERIRVHVFTPYEPEEHAAVRAAFTAADSVGKAVAARGSVPLTEALVIGSVATHALAYLINTLRKTWSKGVVIDAMGRQVTVRNNPALPRGLVVVRSKSGEVTVRDGAGLNEILASALPGRGGDLAAGSTDPAGAPGATGETGGPGGV